MSAVLSKKQVVTEYLTKNPQASRAQAARDCNCSEATVINVRRKLGLTRTMERTHQIGVNGSKHAIALPNQNQMQSLRNAIEITGSMEKLVELLKLVENAGGIEAVQSTVNAYQTLHTLFEKN